MVYHGVCLARRRYRLTQGCVRRVILCRVVFFVLLRVFPLTHSAFGHLALHDSPVVHMHRADSNTIFLVACLSAMVSAC